MCSACLLKTPRLLLRPFREEDAPSLYEYASDPEIGWMCGWEPHESPEQSLLFIREDLIDDLTWAVALRTQPDKVIGAVTLIRPEECSIPLEDDELCLGFWIGRPFWNQGYMSEAAMEVCRYAFECLNAGAIQSTAADFNSASQAVQRHLGMKPFARMTRWLPQLNTVRTSLISIVENPKGRRGL